jgi:hypothetical protein
LDFIEVFVLVSFLGITCLIINLWESLDFWLPVGWYWDAFIITGDDEEGLFKGLKHQRPEEIPWILQSQIVLKIRIFIGYLTGFGAYLGFWCMDFSFQGRFRIPNRFPNNDQITPI